MRVVKGDAPAGLQQDYVGALQEQEDYRVVSYGNVLGTLEHGVGTLLEALTRAAVPKNELLVEVAEWKLLIASARRIHNLGWAVGCHSSSSLQFKFLFAEEATGPKGGIQIDRRAALSASAEIISGLKGDGGWIADTGPMLEHGISRPGHVEAIFRVWNKKEFFRLSVCGGTLCVVSSLFFYVQELLVLETETDVLSSPEF